MPALRRVRDRRAARQRPGRGGAAAPPRQGTAQRADPARVRGGAVPPLPDPRRRGLRGVAVPVRPGRRPAGLQQRPAGHPRPVPGSRLQHQRLQAARADPGLVHGHLTLAHLAGHRAGRLRPHRTGGKRRAVAGQAVGRVLRPSGDVDLPAVGGLRPGREAHLAASRGARDQPAAGHLPGLDQAPVRHPRRQENLPGQIAHRVSHRDRAGRARRGIAWPARPGLPRSRRRRQTGMCGGAVGWAVRSSRGSGRAGLLRGGWRRRAWRLRRRGSCGLCRGSGPRVWRFHRGGRRLPRVPGRRLRGG